MFQQFNVYNFVLVTVRFFGFNFLNLNEFERITVRNLGVKNARKIFVFTVRLFVVIQKITVRILGAKDARNIF